ncbi:hypothetical protein ACFO4L_15630 [Bacillus daqingensis]|uniref:Uncharacterized protein n=2 Tax=Bacillus daqingensis TaxID=872396 RepID=A0ABV9P1L8_9BACI
MLQTGMLFTILCGQLLLLILFYRTNRSRSPHSAESFKSTADEEKKRLVELQLLAMHNACARQRDKLHMLEIQVTDPKLPFALSKVPLHPLQLRAAEESYQLYAEYVHTYWKTEQGNWKTAFRGRFDEPDTEAGNVRAASIQLEDQLQKRLQIWYEEERNDRG